MDNQRIAQAISRAVSNSPASAKVTAINKVSHLSKQADRMATHLN